MARKHIRNLSYLAGVLAVFVFACFMSLKQGRDWQAFRAQHSCRVTSRIPANAETTAKVVWTCDDGKEYYR